MSDIVFDIMWPILMAAGLGFWFWVLLVKEPSA